MHTSPTDPPIEALLRDLLHAATPEQAEAPLRALHGRPVMDASALTPLLDAPTPQAQRFALDRAGFHRLLDARPALLRAAHLPEALRQHALARIHAGEARGAAEAIYPEARFSHSDPATAAETFCLLEAGGPSAHLRADLTLTPEPLPLRDDRPHPPEAALALHLRAPRQTWLDRSALYQLGAAFARAIGADPARLTLHMNRRDAQATLSLPLAPRPPATLLHNARPVLLRMAEAFTTLHRADPVAPERSRALYDALLDDLQPLAALEDALVATSPATRDRLDDTGAAWLALASPTSPAADAAILYPLTSLTAPAPAAGLTVLLHLHAPPPAQLASQLAALLSWKLQAPFESCAPPSLPGPRLYAVAVALTPHPRRRPLPATPHTIARLVTALQSALEELVRLLHQAPDALEPLGLSLGHAPHPAPPLLALASAPLASAPLASPQPIVAVRAAPAPEPEPTIPTARPAAEPDPAPSAPRLEDLGATPSEIIRNMVAGIAYGDVYLRSVGHSPAKLVTIMAILLTISTEEAQRLLDRAPCLLIENVPKARARQIRTVLEGTGARILITDHGQSLDADAAP